MPALEWEKGNFQTRKNEQRIGLYAMNRNSAVGTVSENDGRSGLSR